MTLHPTILNSDIFVITSDFVGVLWSWETWDDRLDNMVIVTLETTSADTSGATSTRPVAISDWPPWLVGTLLPGVTFTRFETILPLTIDTDGLLVCGIVTVVTSQDTLLTDIKVPVFLIRLGWF